MSYGQDFGGRQPAGQAGQQAYGDQQQDYGAPQQQAYGEQQGYGAQRPWSAEQPWGGAGYATPPPTPKRRKRHLLRYTFGGIAGIIVVIVAISVANGGGHSVQTTGSPGGLAGTPGTPGTPTTSGASASRQTATIGTAITLAGFQSSEQMSVVVTKVVSDAAASDEFSSPQPGDRLYAVQFRLTDTGSAAYSDAPSNGAAVVDSSGQSYQSSLDSAAGCQEFPGTENIAPRSSGLGCIVFEVPVKAKIVAVQFTLDSGMGPQTGQWSVAG